MRILLITSGYPPDYSGSGKRIKYSLDSLKKKYNSIKVKVITKTRDSSIIYDKNVIYKYENYNINKILFFLQIFIEYLEYKKVVKKIDLYEYDAIHYVGFTWFSVFISNYFKKIKIFQIRELTSQVDVRSRSLTIGRLIFNLFVKKINNNSDILIAISKRLQKDAQIQYPSKKIYFRYNLIDIFQFKYSEKDLIKRNSNETFSKLNWTKDNIIFLNIAHINENKNQIYLIHRLKSLPDKFKLIIIGPTYAEDKYYLKKLSELIKAYNLQNRVHLVNKYEKNIKYYYQISDIFLLPSKMEGFGNVVLEAMAMGLPVLANKIPGVTDTIIKNNINGHLFSLDKNNLTKL